MGESDEKLNATTCFCWQIGQTVDCVNQKLELLTWLTCFTAAAAASSFVELIR